MEKSDKACKQIKRPKTGKLPLPKDVKQWLPTIAPLGVLTHAPHAPRLKLS